MTSFVCVCLFWALHAVGTKIIADPDFQESISEKIPILLRDRPCQELIILSSQIQASLFLLKKIVEPKKATGPALSRARTRNRF